MFYQGMIDLCPLNEMKSATDGPYISSTGAGNLMAAGEHLMDFCLVVTGTMEF